MKLDNVLITGLGCIGDFGAGKLEFKDSLDHADGPKKKLSDFNFADYMDTSMLRRADENSCLASVAAKMAVDDAGLDLEKYARGKTGMVMATTHGPLAYTLEYHQQMVVGDAHMVSPLLFSNSLPNTMASYVGNIFKICGPTTTFTGYNAVLQALKCGGELIAEGVVDICLVGGVDVYNNVLREAYRNCLKDPEKVSDSFGGSGVIVLESSRSAGKRSAKPYAELLKTEINTLNYSQEDSCTVVAADLTSSVEADGVEQIITSCWDNEECRRGMDMILEKAKETIPVVDCSERFAFTFTAGEVFKVIFAILKVADKKQNKILVQSVTKLGSSGSLLLGGYEGAV
jgi:3-oxoacyl-(acyl-carrier-protein) synthase